MSDVATQVVEVKSETEVVEKSYLDRNPALKFTMLKVYMSGKPFTRITGPMKIVTR